MQKKKARKGFLFLRRESVLPPCRAGPVCPAGTNAVFCGGTHGSRPTDRCGKPSVGDGVLDVPSAPRCKAPSVRGLSAQPTGGEKVSLFGSPSVSASRCHLPRRGRQGRMDCRASTTSRCRGGRLCPPRCCLTSRSASCRPSPPGRPDPSRPEWWARCPPAVRGAAPYRRRTG